MKIELPFTDWAPDRVGADVRQVFNVLPAPEGWQPFPHPAATAVVGLPHEPLFLDAVRSASGLDYTLTGDAEKIYRASVNSWLAYDGVFDALTPWRTAIYGDVVYFVNGRDPVLRLDLNGSLGPEPVPDLPLDLGGRYIAQVADVMMLAWCVEQGVNQRPFRTQWSGVGRPERYTPNTAIQADFQDHTDIGELRGLAGGEYALILGEFGLIRGDYTGPPEVFQFRTLETDVGCQYPGSLAWSSGRAIWWSRSGFRLSAGGPSTPIGFGIIDEFFKTRLRKEYAHRISAKIYPEYNCYMIGFPGSSAFTGLPSEIIAYNYVLNRWGFAQFDHQCFGRGTSSLVTFTDDADVGDLMTDSRDGNTDDGTSLETFPAVMVGGGLKTLRLLSTTRCELEIAERELSPGRRSRVSRMYPLIEPQPVSMRGRVYTREIHGRNDLANVSPDLSVEDDGSIACDDAGRLHRFSIRWDGGWTKARSLEVDYTTQGAR